MGLLDWAFRPVIDAINNVRKEMKMNMTELLAQLQGLKTQADKAKAEVIAKIAALEEAINNAGTTTPEVDAALTDLKASVQGLDDLNPDAEPTP